MEIKRILRKLSGLQAYQDRKEAVQVRDSAEEHLFVAQEKTIMLRTSLNASIEKFGQRRLESLKKTVGVFIRCLNDMERRNTLKQYEILDSIDIKSEKIRELESIEMSASQILKGTIASASFGAVALSGVPTAVTSLVAACATASTGTAISTLSGAAASNAVLAWLGGGSLAAGGMGVAGGTAVLSALTWTATGGAAILVAGFIASAHYSKKLTEAREYEKNVDIRIAQMEKAWVVMEGIAKRVQELDELTEDLTVRALQELKFFCPLVPDFDFDDEYSIEVFQKNGLLVKAIGELAKATVLDEKGELSEETTVVIGSIRNVLNTQLAIPSNR